VVTEGRLEPGEVYTLRTISGREVDFTVIRNLATTGGRAGHEIALHYGQQVQPGLPWQG
jgi:hypothetical protein